MILGRTLRGLAVGGLLYVRFEAGARITLALSAERISLRESMEFVKFHAKVHRRNAVP